MNILSENYSMKEDIVSRTNPNGTIVLMKMDDSEIFFKISGVAAEVWKGIEDGSDLNQTISKIVDDYNCSADQVEQDTRSFIEELIKKDLISSAT
ncbi:MAG: PqqD family protein [Bacteriovoracaceae bacterium]|nr:PqqD family protein [Bacteriovoracaceae bacterium]